MLRRILLTVSNTQCPYGCKYCFADFSQYQRPFCLTDLESSPHILEDVDVIYPACDMDLFATNRHLDILRKTAALGRSISISTKAVLSNSIVTELARLAVQLRTFDCVLKVGISISTKSNCGTLEPRAACYSKRLLNLKLLKQAFVPNCVVLKPLLSDIPLSEYYEILHDVVGLTQNILIGDEYLDVATPRTQATNQRTVSWAVNQPIWPVNFQSERKTAIKMRASALGLHVFDSDLDLIAALLQMRNPNANSALADESICH